MKNDIETIRMSNGAITTLSRDVYYDVYLEFDQAKEDFFSMMIHNGAVFPTIIQYIYVITSLCAGHSSIRDIMLITISSGAFYMLVWYLFKIYKLAINTICFTIERFILKPKIHWIAIILISLLVNSNWKAILYCVIAAIISCILRMLMFMVFSNVRYNDEVAIHVSRFKT